MHIRTRNGYRTIFIGSIAVAALFIYALWVGVSHAAVSSNVVADVTTLNQTVMASSSPVAVLSLNLAGDQTLASTSIAFAGANSFSTTTDFAALASATSSGVALYRDNKSGGTAGSFDSTDVVVPLLMASTSWNGSTTTLTFATPEVVPANDTGGNAGADYFIVIRTAPAAALNGHTFTASMYPGSIGWTGAQPAGPTTVTTNTITGDTTAPTLDTTRTGPMNGSTGVPVSMFPHLSFSESLDQTTLNSSNITLTSTTTIGTAIRPFPDGFDIIVSSPPVYASASRFAKATTGGSSFLQINGTSQIFPQGTYAAPAAGDIVYMQMDTFPPDVGIVTNPTLTSGTFAVNGFALFRPLQLTKFAAATATGNVSGGASTGVGDLILANTSANPTDVKYNWHIVTTAAAINNASLRLDGASAQPTYATTTFSRLMPTATSTVNGSSVLTASTTFAVGNLVFAKLMAGGDNLNAYAWHLVTAVTGAGILGPDGGGGTVSLDGASPTFTANSVVAKLATPAGQGAIDTGAQDATSFSFGDLMFAKVTANAGNTGAYAFHIVSNGATGATSTALRLDNSASNLLSSTAYTVTAGTGIKDKAGNPLASAATISFTTGSTGGTNTTPPFVQSTQPMNGNQQFAPNGKIKLAFSVAMLADGSTNAVDNTSVVKLSTSVNGAPSVAVTATNAYDATTNTVTITPGANLLVNTDYVVQVTTAARSATGASLPGEYRLYFRTSSAVDNTAPSVLGVNPANGSTNSSVSQVFTAGFSKDMDPATITGSTVKLLAQVGGASVSGNVSYNPQSRSANFAPSTALSTATGYAFQIGAGLTGPADLSSNRLSATSTTYATTTATADTAAPSVSFASADNFGIAITFAETMRTGGGPNAVDNAANYTLESPVGTTISLGGKSVTYDPGTKTARISGLSLQNGNQFKLTVAAPVQDLAGNNISTSGTPAGNLAFGSVQSSTMTGGQLGPGSGTIDQSMQGMNPTRVVPMTHMAGVASNYKVEFPVTTAIPLGGQVVLTFPSGFDVTNAAMVATSTGASFCNGDINGPGTGAPYILTVANDPAAGTITLTTAGASTGGNAFVCMDLSGIVNSTVPSASGYSTDIKLRDTSGNNRSIIEMKTASPFFLGAAGTRTLTANIFNDGNGNGAINANEGIANVKVFLFSPAAGGQSTTTNASGVATFTSLADGDYMVGVDPMSLAVASSTVSYNSAPQPFTVSSTNLTKNFIVSGAGSTVTVSGTVSGPANTSIDIFAGSSNGFSKKTLTLTGGADAYSLSVQTNTTYNIGVGPAMPDTAFIPGAPPPPPPSFTFMPPPPLSVIVGTTSVTGANFVLASTSKTIAGSVLDANGSAVSNAGVFARPVATSTAGTASGFGTGAMTNTSGAFTINVVPGTYLVGVFKPGMPSVPDQQIIVPSSGSNTPTSLTFKLGVGSSLTISGTVKDDSGNAVPYAGVSGRKITSTSDTTPIGGGQGNFVGGPTDGNGAYTLYVTNGIWQIEAFAPGFGKLGSKTVTVSGSSLSGQDFSAQTLNFGTITGSTTQASIGVQGVMVRAEGSSGANMAVSDASGSYSLKVPAGSYALSCFFPGIGDATSTASSVTVTSGGTATGNNCALGSPITVTVRLTDGTNPITNAFVDARTSAGRGNGTGANTTSGIYSVYTLTLQPGTYTVRAGSPAFGPIGSTASVSTTQTITYTAPQLFTVSGTVTAGSAVSGAWISLTGIPTGQTNTIVVGAQTDASGVYSISIPAGSYQIRADKPGYISSTPTTVTVAGNTTGIALALTTASQTITGTVTLNSSGVSGAFVDATNSSGGFAVAQTDSSGAYSLPVSSGTWTLTAHSIGYTGTLSGVAAGATGQTITLSAISGFTVTAERQETVTPTAGGLLTNSDIGSAFKLNIPANALGTGSNAGTVKTQANTALPNVANGTVLAKNGVSISAVDSSGQPVKNLNESVTVVVPYSESDIPAGKSESDLQLGVWNGATSYDILPTTVDTVNNTLTATVSHFSDFAPIVPSQSSTPSNSSTPASTPVGNGAPVGGGGGGGLTVEKPRAQIIYPDGRIVYVDQLGGTSAEGDATVSAGSAKSNAQAGVRASVAGKSSAVFAASLKHGSRGADVKRLQQLLGVESSGYFGLQTQKAVQAFQLQYKIVNKGGIGYGALGPKTRAKIAEVFGLSVAAQAQTANAGSASKPATAPASFTKPLKRGSRGADVKRLQQFLGVEATGYFGPATQRAIEAYQEAHGIAKKGAVGFGTLGPNTRASVNAQVQAGLPAGQAGTSGQ